jgi:hypothetical protein
MTYAILQISAAAYKDIRDRLTALDERLRVGPQYERAFIRPGAKEHLVFGPVGFEALPAPTEDLTESQREQIAEILETVAKYGLDGPRDLDVALDAIGCAMGPA